MRWRVGRWWLVWAFAVGCGEGVDPFAIDVAAFGKMDGELTPEKLCDPWEVRCPSLLVSDVCSQDGERWESVDCVAGQTCLEEFGGCMPQVCEPFVTECQGDRTIRTCGAAGRSWEEGACAEGSFCSEGACVYGPCLGHVLLVLDRSASMIPHWPALHSSVLKLVSDRPTTRFGLMTFPSDTPCEVESSPEIPLSTHQTEASFNDFFDAVKPVFTTPLLFAMETARTYRASLFKGQEGVVVVLSDGQETCEKGDPDLLEKLSDVTDDLSQDGIRTYVIGYSFQGNTAQLDAIAAAGSTGLTTHLKAGNEVELDAALDGIISDMKLCF